jgi:hypothetical protein
LALVWTPFGLSIVSVSLSKIPADVKLGFFKIMPTSSLFENAASAKSEADSFWDMPLSENE